MITTAGNYIKELDAKEAALIKHIKMCIAYISNKSNSKAGLASAKRNLEKLRAKKDILESEFEGMYCFAERYGFDREVYGTGNERYLPLHQRGCKEINGHSRDSREIHDNDIDQNDFEFF